MTLFVGGNGPKNVKLILRVWKKGRQSPSLARGCLSSRKYAIHLCVPNDFASHKKYITSLWSLFTNLLVTEISSLISWHSNRNTKRWNRKGGYVDREVERWKVKCDQYCTYSWMAIREVIKRWQTLSARSKIVLVIQNLLGISPSIFESKRDIKISGFEYLAKPKSIPDKSATARTRGIPISAHHPYSWSLGTSPSGVDQFAYSN